MSENGTFTTHDLGFAAYLKMSGFELKSATKERSNGLFNFLFNDPESAAQDLRVEYINSTFARFDSELKTLKKLINVA